MKNKIENLQDFRLWVKLQLVYQGLSQNELARKMGIPHARISEATHGKPSGSKYIVPIVQELGGNVEDFRLVTGRE